MSDWKAKMKKAATFEFPYQYEMIFFLLCVFSAVMFRPDVRFLKPHNVYLYFVNYFKDGFLAKGLIGTIVTTFFTKMTEKQFYILYGCVFALVFGVFLYFLGEVVRIRKKENELFMVYLGSVLCFAPCSITMFTGLEIFGSQEIFLVGFFLVSMLLLIKGKGYGALFPISVIAVFVDERYVFTYLPVVLIGFLYQMKTGQMKNGSKKNRMRLLYLTGGCSYVLAAVLRFFTKSKEKDAVQFYKTLMQRAGFDIAADSESVKKALSTVICDYFVGIKDWFSYRSMTRTDYEIFIISLLLSIPVILFLAYIWTLFVKNSRQKKYAVLFPLSILLLVPLFVFGSDYGWNLFHLLFVSFIAVFSLAGMKDPAMVAALDTVKEKFHRRQWLFWILPVYLLLIGDIDGQGMTIAYLIRELL